MKKYWILFFLSISLQLRSTIEDHFKPALFKEPQHANPIEHVDFAYMINLDPRPEKYERSIKELAPYNIHPYRFSAVNGWELSLETINELGIKYEPWVNTEIWGTCYLPETGFTPNHEIMYVMGRNYFSHGLSPGAIGIILSHLSILQDAYDSGYKTIWVMEDDIEVIIDPLILSELIVQLDQTVGEDNWDILFTDRDTKDQYGNYVPCVSYARRPNFAPLHPQQYLLNEPINDYIRRIGARYGAYSMIVRRSGMKKILDFYKKYQIFLPYDMEYTQPDDIKLYTVLEDIVSTQITALSDNGRANYKDKEKRTETFLKKMNDLLELFW